MTMKKNRFHLPIQMEERIKQLKQLQQLIIRHRDELLFALHEDLGKSEAESLFSEIYPVEDELRLVLAQIRSWYRDTRKFSGLLNFPSSSIIHRRPYGHVLIIAPWNYPVRLSLLPVIGALAAGNQITLKLSPRSPASLQALSSLLKESAVVVNNAEPHELWQDEYDFVFFTGSTATGRIIAKQCAPKLIPYVLELGGKSPVVLLDDAPIAIAAKRILWGKAFNAGQTCVAPDHLWLKASQLKPFIQAFAEAVEHQYQSPLTNALWPKLIDRHHFKRLEAMLDDGHIVYGGEVHEASLKIEPTLLADVEPGSYLDKEEIFGPLLPIYTYENEQDLRQHLLSQPTPLASYVFTAHGERGENWLFNLPFGGGCINDTITHINNPRLPFGGMGSSGMGCYHGKYSYLTFSHEQSIMSRPLWEPEFRYAPWDKALKWIKKWRGEK